MAAAQILMFRTQLRAVTGEAIRRIFEAAEARPLLGSGFSQARLRALCIPTSEGVTTLPTPAEFLVLSYLSGLAPESAIQVLLGQEAHVGYAVLSEPETLGRARRIQAPKDWSLKEKRWDGQVVKDLFATEVQKTVLATLLGVDTAHLREMAENKSIPSPPVAARIYYMAGLDALDAWGVSESIQDEAWTTRARAALEAVCAWTPGPSRSINIVSTPKAAASLDDEDQYEIQRLSRQLPLAAGIKRYGAGVNLLLEDGTGGVWRFVMHFPREGRPLRANLAKLDPTTYVECEDLRSSEVEGDSLVEVLVRMARVHAGIEAWPVVALRWATDAEQPFAGQPDPTTAAEPIALQPLVALAEDTLAQVG